MELNNLGFIEKMELIAKIIEDTGVVIDPHDYDGMIVKKLAETNVGGSATSGQTHVAITGPQMNIFPVCMINGYSKGNADMKKYFVARANGFFYENNIRHLASGTNPPKNIKMNFVGGKCSTFTGVVRAVRTDGTEQLQIGMKTLSAPSFMEFRELWKTNTYLVVLKYKEKVLYDYFGINTDLLSRIGQENKEIAVLSVNMTYQEILEALRNDYHYLTSKDSSTYVDPNDNTINCMGNNTIFYGVPGCGKSHFIKKSINDETRMERVVFHPDYTYSDFVGQILPKVEEDKDGTKHIRYRFIPGPFTRILKQAAADKENYYYLVIEEINRGNAAAIFGDIFQLLDRTDSGESDYGINNEDIASEVYGDASHKIRIPGNLFLYATMNTSDQNVFPLDTAFKRRWELRMIPNDISGCKFAKAAICGTDITWEAFAVSVNDKITELSDSSISGEDNRLGAYFVKRADLNDPKAFAEKVLMYLWNDAFKFDRDKVFEPRYKTLEQLIEDFPKKKFDVFVKGFGFRDDEKND
ncbi:MAG: McrB family protein [Oscillospiraceae bacterium]